jgi:sugar phosphate isomerase/epimerase
MDPGICTATLLVDPMHAPADDIARASRAAVDVGFTEASVWSFQVDAVLGSGLKVQVVEAATAWSEGDADAAAAELSNLPAVVERAGASRALAVCMQPTIADVDAARSNLMTLAERLAAVGAQVCVEFFAWSAIKDLATAWDLVAPLGPSVGLVIDTFHWVRQRGGPDLDVLRAIPGDRISFVQIADAAAQVTDAESKGLDGRLLPGAGVVDFAEFFGVLAEIGAQPFFATEVFNEELVAAKGAKGAAVAMRRAAQAVLTR